MQSRTRNALSAIDVIVSMACLVIMAGLLLPALQAAREKSRAMQCQDHLQRIGQGVLAHLKTHEHYPTNGWGSRWVGDPDLGFGVDQPGGWVYNILPYVGEEKLHDLGKGKSGFAKQAAGRTRLATPVAIFNCPARRKPALYPNLATALLANAARPEKVPKSDYAINGGDHHINTGTGPVSAKPDVLAAYKWPDLANHTGISLVRTQIKVADVTDGTSLTYLAGEKYVPSYGYGLNAPDMTKPKIRGDDGTMYAGCDADTRRWTYSRPLPDSADERNKAAFGSAHPDGFQMLFCDGAVRTMSYEIDEVIHRSLGNRHDGAPKDAKSFDK